MANRNNTRQFSYTTPILYQGAEYPSTLMDIADDKGNIQNRNVFTDNKGQYYTVNNGGKAIPIILQHSLPEVVVTAPRENLLSKQFNDYLTMSNDNTMVNNVPHREYNPQLRYSAVQGAKANALWDKEHPNFAAWRDVATALPFAVAAAPFTTGAAEYVGGTALGQGITRGLGYVTDVAKNSTWLPWADAAATSYFGAKGLQDMQNGTFTPETAMDVLPLGRLGRAMYNAEGEYFDLGKPLLKRKTKLKEPNFNVSSNADDGTDMNNMAVPFNGFKEDPLQMHYKRAKAKGYDPSSIEIYNLAENTTENTKLINKFAKENNISPEQAYNEIVDFLNTHGHGAAFPGQGIVLHDGKMNNPSVMLSHEVDHALHIPEEALPDNVFYPRIKSIHGDYFTQNNNTEVAARGSQLHDYFGHTGTEPITVDNLKYARKHYVRDVGIDNTMHDFLWSIKDFGPVAKWMTKYSTGVVPIGIINNSQSNK